MRGEIIWVLSLTVAAACVPPSPPSRPVPPRMPVSCFRDADCEGVGGPVGHLGFCTAADGGVREGQDYGVCNYTCRTVQDCEHGYTCANSSCVYVPCLAFGGAQNACAPGRFCSGEDRNGDGAPDPAPPGEVVDAWACYSALRTSFCRTCETDGDCAGLSNQSSMPNRCRYAGDKADAGDGVKLCMLGASTDLETPADGGISPADRFCPAHWLAGPVFVDVAPQSSNHCERDRDCRKGNTTGECTRDLGVLKDGGFTWSCECRTDADCPQDVDAGLSSFCVGSLNRRCATSVVCTARAYESVAQGGCGF